MVSDEVATEIFSFGVGMLLGDITYALVELAKDDKDDRQRNDNG